MEGVVVLHEFLNLVATPHFFKSACLSCMHICAHIARACPIVSTTSGMALGALPCCTAPVHACMRVIECEP